jgi:hypothetical protein
MTPQLTEILTGLVLHLGIASFFAWWLARSLRRSGLSGWWFLPVILIALFLKWYIGMPLIFVLLMWLGSRAPADKSGKAFRFGDWFSRSVLGFLINKKAKLQAWGETLRSGVVNMKVAVGLIVLTAVGTYVIAHPRPHHFESWKGNSSGTVLLDTDTGVLCSTRVIMIWTDANMEEVQAASQADSRAGDALTVAMGELNSKLDDSQGKFNCATAPVNSALEVACEKEGDADDARREAESKYDAAVRKANAEQVNGFPLCKDIR